MSNGQNICLVGVSCDGDVGGEVEMDWQWPKFVEVKQFAVGDNWDVENECKYFGDPNVEM